MYLLVNSVFKHSTRIFKIISCPQCSLFKVQVQHEKNLIPSLHILCRNYMKKTTDKVEESLRTKDDVPEDYTLIYRVGFENYMRSAQIISTVFSVTGALAFLYFYIYQGYPLGSLEIEGIRHVSYENAAMVFGFLLSNYAIQRVIYICPVRIYKKDDSYILVRNLFLPIWTKKRDFISGNVRARKTWLPFILAGYKVKNSKLILISQCFRTPQDFLEMLSSSEDD